MGLDGLESICFWVEVDFEQVIREFLFHCWQEEERQIAPAICSDVASCDDFYWVLLGFVRFRSIMVRKAATDVSARPSSSLAGLDWVWLGYTVLIKLKLCWFEFISKLSLFIVVRAGNERTNCVFKPFPLPNKYNYPKKTRQLRTCFEYSSSNYDVWTFFSSDFQVFIFDTGPDGKSNRCATWLPQLGAVSCLTIKTVMAYKNSVR